MAPTVTRSHPNRAYLGCGGTGASFPGCASHNLHKLQDAILSIWANISKECFQHLVESMPHRMKAVLKAKGGQTQYYGVPNNPLGVCRLHAINSIQHVMQLAMEIPLIAQVVIQVCYTIVFTIE